jgi:hypothetical protein
MVDLSEKNPEGRKKWKYLIARERFLREARAAPAVRHPHGGCGTSAYLS